MQNRVRELRTAAGITQEQLAQLTGVTRQTIISIENGGIIRHFCWPIRLRVASG